MKQSELNFKFKKKPQLRQSLLSSRVSENSYIRLLVRVVRSYFKFLKTNCSHLITVTPYCFLVPFPYFSRMYFIYRTL